MKKVFSFCLLCIILCVLTSCGSTAGQTSGTASKTGNTSKTGNAADPGKALEAVDALESLNAELGSALAGFRDLSEVEKYQKLDGIRAKTAAVGVRLDEIQKFCDTENGSEDLEYQIRLIRNLEPDFENMDSENLARLTSLAPLYRAQLNSSLKLIRRDLESLKSGNSLTEGVRFFPGVSEMARPETILSGFAFVEEGTEEDMTKFVYAMPADPDEASAFYSLYLLALNKDTGLQLSMSDSGTFVTKDGEVVSIIAPESGSDGNRCTVYFAK